MVTKHVVDFYPDTYICRLYLRRAEDQSWVSTWVGFVLLYYVAICVWEMNSTYGNTHIKLLTLQVYMYFLICHSTQNSVFRNETRTILAEGGHDHVIATITWYSNSKAKKRRCKLNEWPYAQSHDECNGCAWFWQSWRCLVAKMASCNSPCV